MPPPESGRKDPVPVLTELRRIALLTAIAEKLRDQGVPLPFWMRDYPVQAVAFEKTTPALDNPRSKANRTVRIFGGVSLSPPSADVKLLTDAAEVGRLPKEERAAAREILDRSASLAPAVRTQMAAPQLLAVKRLTGAAAGYQGLAVPGGDTQALAPAILEETDLAIPIGGGQDIRLVRRFNAFFDPVGPWGKGWALDLPRLQEVKVPEKREAEGKVTDHLVQELVTPLNSVYARFARTAAVPELKASQLRVPDRPGQLLALADGQPDFLTRPTRAVIRKDGGRWHFSEAGDLVATEHNGYRTFYERDAAGRISRILGLQGKSLAASIQLSYDPASGRLKAASGQRETGRAARDEDRVSVRYEYGPDGRLSAAHGVQGRMGYRYEGPRVVAVTYQAVGAPGAAPSREISLRRFEYNPRGQLLAETDADGNRTEYRIGASATEHSLAVVPSGAPGAGASVRYDLALRPIEAQYADGSKASWTYPQGGGVAMELIQADGGKIGFTETADLSRRTLALGKHCTLIGSYDGADRLTSLTDNDRLLLRQAWSADGRLTLAAAETAAVHPNYDAEGLLTRLVQTPPQEQGPFKRWQETRLDPAGRPREISDYRGLKVAMDYDGSGDLIAMSTQRDGKNYGYQINRDAAGRVKEVKSSWGGKQQYAYDKAGQLQRLDLEEGGAKARIEWKAGLLARVEQFDGGKLAIDYYQDGSHAGLPAKITTPNALVLKYQYDASNRLASVDIGSQSRLALGYDAKGRIAAWTHTPARP